MGRRLGSGRIYARHGQVIDLEIGKGSVTAKVQGSRDAPYLVRMHFSMLSFTDWKKIIRVIGEDPERATRLIVGDIPDDIEDVFNGLGLSLFPSANGDLKTACSCPDQANPCKHIAAVYYVIGEEFDRDPYLVFRLRGIERGELNDAIREMSNLHGATPDSSAEEDRPARNGERAETPPSAFDDENEHPEPRAREAQDAPKRPRSEPPPAPPEPEPMPLPADPHSFWAGAGSTAEDLREVRVPKTVAALPRRLGGYPFWSSELDSRSLLDHIYRNASPAGLDVFLVKSDAQKESTDE